LRALILGGDFFTGSVLASTLTKLVLRYAETQSDSQDVNSLRAEALLIMTSVIRVGQSKFSAVPIDEDSQERIMNCIETLAQLQGSKVVKQIFLEDTKSAYARMVATEEVSLHDDGWDPADWSRRRHWQRENRHPRVLVSRPMISFHSVNYQRSLLVVISRT
jgi:vesicle coat complex subunit